MRLVVGLGNPGTGYQDSRHNFGFRVADALATKVRATDMGRRWHGVAARGRIAGSEIYILKPQTFMNLSGLAVAAAVRDLKCSTEDVLIICDDLALDLGVLRFRPRGSSGGQKGLGSVIEHMGTENISRLRLGIGSESQLIPKDYVLQDFSSTEREIVEKVIRRAVPGIQCWAIRGISAAMQTYNGNVPETES